MVTKTDKINQSEKAKLIKNLTAHQVDLDKICYTSSLKPSSMDELKRRIEKGL